MKSSVFNSRFLFLTIAIVIAAISRLLPHPPNFTPIGGMALFSGACFINKRFAFIIPLLAMFLSDCIIGFHSTMGYVYISFIAITFIGIYIGNNAKPTSIVLASLISSILFFVVTNFGVWAAGGFQMGLSGLAGTYLIAIPFYSNTIFGSFFANTIIGDLFYCAILFGSLYFAKAKFPSLA